MIEKGQQGWVLLSVLLLLLLVAVPLSVMQREWYYLGQQQGYGVSQLQAELQGQSLSQRASALLGQEHE